MTQTKECWRRPFEKNHRPAADLPLWREAFAGIEFALLRFAPVYYGFTVPHGDGSPVVVIPGFLGGDTYLAEMYAWLYRLDYRPYFSGIHVNAECPNLLIQRNLNAAIDKAQRETGKKVHLIGHSLGGVLAMSVGAQRPDDIASIITLGSPFRGTVAHPNVLKIAEYVRKSIRLRNGTDVLPTCYTGHCTCNFISSLKGDLPVSVMMTAIYSRTDAVVDWRYCITGDSSTDFQAPGTHIGLAFNPSVYTIIAKRLAEALERSDVPQALPQLMWTAASA